MHIDQRHSRFHGLFFDQYRDAGFGHDLLLDHRHHRGFHRHHAGQYRQTGFGERPRGKAGGGGFGGLRPGWLSGIACLLLAHRLGELIRHCRLLAQVFGLGGLLQQAVQVRLQGHLGPGAGLPGLSHQATCTAVL
ncbi:hypothetical protein D9M73_230280 [compost metagenome]